MARADLIKQVEEEIARREEEKRKSLQIQDATQKTGTAQVPEANILAQKLARQSKQQGGNRASTLMTQLQMSGGLTGREQTRVAAHLAAQQWKQKTKAQQAETYAEVIKGMKEAAQKEYDDYIATPEYQLYKQNTPQSQPLNVGAPSPTNPYYGMTDPNQEATYRDQAAPGQPQYRERKEESPEGKREAELKQKVDYWQRMENAYRDQSIYFADMEAINAMPEEDRQALHNYVEVMRKGGVVPAMMQSGDGMNLAQKYGAENFRNYAETYERYLSAQEAEKARELGKLGINNDGLIGPEILQSIGSVGANLIGAVTSPVEAIKGLVSGTGRYSTMDPNGLGNLPHIYAGAVRENVGGEIRNAGGKYVGEAGAALYNAGMSALDSLSRVALTGGTGSLALSATGSFGQTVQDASRAGASPVEAVGLGIITGGLEVVTEKVSLDRLLGDIGGNPKNAAQIVKSALIQGRVEVSEEELALLGSTLAEAAILRGDSSYNQNVQRLMMEEGLSYEDAVRKADKALVMEAWQTMYTSFLSGGMMSGATSTYSYITTPREGTTPAAPGTKQTTPETGNAFSPGGEVPVTVREGKTGMTAPMGETAPNETGMVKGDAPVVAVEPGRVQLETPMTRLTNVDPRWQEAQKLAAETGRNIVFYTAYDDSVGYLKDDATYINTVTRLTVKDALAKIDHSMKTKGNGGIIDVTESGNNVFDGGGKRSDGTGSGEQTGNLAGRTGQAAERDRSGIDRLRTQNRRGNLSTVLRNEKVSAKSLGVKRGTERPTVQVIPEENWDNSMRQKADQIYEETGKTVTYVLGAIEVEGIGGRTVRVNGVCSDTGVVVRADHGRFTAEQIADHEAYHTMKAIPEYRGLDIALIQRITEEFSQEEFDEIVGNYIQALRGVIDVEGAQDGETFEARIREVEEELLADAHAGMNWKGLGANRFTETVNRYLEDNWISRPSRQGNGTEQPTGPPSGDRYSIETLPDGKKYVRADRQVIFGNDPDSWSEQVEDYINARIRGGEDVTLIAEDGDVLTITSTTAGKLADNHTSRGTTMSDEAFYLKANAAIHIDELAEVSRAVPGVTRRDVGGRHGEFASSGWIYRTAYFMDFDGKYYRIRISAAKNPDGTILYNIGDVKERSFPTVDGSSAKGGALGGKTSSKKSVPRAMPEVKKQIDAIFNKVSPNHAMQMQRYTELKDSDPALAQRFYDSMMRGPYRLEFEEYLSLAEQLGQEQYSVDDSEEDYDALENEYQAQRHKNREDFFRERLGEDGYRRYKDYKQTKAEQARRESRAKSEERRMENLAKANHEEKRLLREETKPTKAKKAMKDKLLNIFSVPAGRRAEIGKLIDAFADRIIKNGSLTEDDRRVFFDRMYESGVMTQQASDYFRKGRELVAGGKVYVNESLRADYGDDWQDFRRRSFAAGIYLTNNRSDGGVDQWNHELADLLPGLFDSEETDARTILERIIKIAEEGRDENVSLAEYTARLAETEHIPENEFLDNMERQMDWALRTFAEAAEVEMETKARDIRKASGTRRQNIQLQARLAAERQERIDKARRQKERRELREMQQKTLKQLQWLHRNQHRAPEELQDTFREVLGDIDIYAVGAANEMNWSDKWGATWKDISQMYKDSKKNDPNFMPSEELVKIVTRLDATKIEDLDPAALSDLYKAAVGLRTEFYNRNNVINDEMHRLFAEVYTDSKNEIEAAPAGFTGNKADKLLNMDQLTPMNVLQRMAGWDPNSTFYSMAKQLEQGERDVRAFTVKAQAQLKDFLTDNADWVKKADGQGKDGLWEEIEIPELVALELGKPPRLGKTIKVWITPAQKVHMYLESKNLDNLRHMTGGRTFADKDLYRKGKRQEAFAQGKTVRMAPETVKAIVAKMTQEEMELARLLDQYYNVFATGEINRVSNILYGYDKAMGGHYAPIYTNQNYVKSEFGLFDTTAEGVGNLKGRVHAVNPSYNISAFDAFERNVEHTARFVGMAIPARNWTTLLNWRVQHNSTADVITHKWGEEGKKYISDLITKLQAGDKPEGDSISNTADRLMSNYISSVFGANPSIVLKQLGSIPMAAPYLGLKNFPSITQIRNIDRELISKYTSELEWRTMGYSMPETKQLKNNPNWTETNKLTKFTFGGGAITAMDGWAASLLWPWAENKVTREHQELKPGSDEFYNRVAEEFNYSLVRSQSVSDMMHQSTLRKSRNPITRTLTMFRADSAQAYNALRQMIGEAKFYSRTGEVAAAKRASKAVGGVICAMLANAVWAEAVSFLMAMWKNKGKNYRDDEGELTAESVLREMLRNMVESLAGTVAGGDELAQLIGNAITGDKRYDLEAPGLEQVNDILTMLYNVTQGNFGRIGEMVEVSQNGGNRWEYFHSNSGEILGEIKDTAQTVATFFGIPVNNVEAYLLGTLKWISPKLGDAYDDAFRNVDKNDLKGLEGDALDARLGRILHDRKVEVSDSTVAALAELYEAGFTRSVPGNVPSTVTIEGERVEINLAQQQAYAAIWAGTVAGTLEELVSSDKFEDADPKTQEKMLMYLYTYADEMAKAEIFDGYDPDTRDESVEAYADAGLTMADFLYTYGKYSEIYAMDGKAGAKATAFARWLDDQDYTKAQKDVIKNELVFYTMSPASSKQYDKMVKKGVDPDEAYSITQDVGALTPPEGEDKVENVHKWRACISGSNKPATQMAMLYAYMTQQQYAKMETANTFGVNPDVFVGYYEAREKYDTNGNGSYSNAEVKAAIDSLSKYNLSKGQKAVLWQLMTGSKSARNNPYSVEEGEQVLRFLAED